MRREFQGTDKGKRVVAGDGRSVGTVVRTDGDRAQVLLDPERSESDTVDPTGEATGDGLYTIDRRAVAESTNERIRLVESVDPPRPRKHA